MNKNKIPNYIKSEKYVVRQYKQYTNKFHSIPFWNNKFLLGFNIQPKLDQNKTLYKHPYKYSTVRYYHGNVDYFITTPRWSPAVNGLSIR